MDENTTASEVNYISQCFYHAEKQGLGVEFIWQLIHEIKPDISFTELQISCEAALNEWDI